MDKEPITKDGLEKIKERVRQLKKCERQKVVAAISEQDHSDLKNAEYHAAKEQQAKIEGRVLSINDTLLEQMLLMLQNWTTTVKLYLAQQLPWKI